MINVYENIMTFSFVRELELRTEGKNSAVIVKRDVSGDEFMVISVVSAGPDKVRKCTVIDLRCFPPDCSSMILTSFGGRDHVNLTFPSPKYATSPKTHISMQSYVF